MERIGSHDGARAHRVHKAHDGKIIRAGRAGRLVTLTGGIVSLGLVVGMAVWAVQLVMRDVSGVPVIRALEGPMRSAPADPGGVRVDHMGLAVNRLAEGAEAGQVPDRLVLAPPPVDLGPLALVSASLSLDPVDPTPDADPTPEKVSEQIHELIERLIARNDPDHVAAADPAMADQSPSEAQRGGISVIPASVAGVAQSIRPMIRPRSMAAGAPAVTQASAIPTAELDPADLALGTRLVQLGAFDTPELARAEWAHLSGRFPDYFTGRGRVIQQASAGGAPFFRLRAHGFEDLAAARRFCAALMAQDAPCVPVTVR